jgi:uncharacterized membrane protein
MFRRFRRIEAIVAAVAIDALAAYGCSGQLEGASSTTDASSMVDPCSVPAPTMCPSPAPKYADVAPVLENKCVTCHSGADGGPWPLTGYGNVAAWQSEIGAELVHCSMPPADAGAPITAEERTLLLTWLVCGAPE